MNANCKQEGKRRKNLKETIEWLFAFKYQHGLPPDWWHIYLGLLRRLGCSPRTVRQLFTLTAKICAFYLLVESRSIAFSQQLPAVWLIFAHKSNNCLAVFARARCVLQSSVCAAAASVLVEQSFLAAGISRTFINCILIKNENNNVLSLWSGDCLLAPAPPRPGCAGLRPATKNYQVCLTSTSNDKQVF